MVSPDTPLAQVPLVAMDFETTGLNADRDDIVSIGLVPLSLQRIRLSGSVTGSSSPMRPCGMSRW